MRDVENEVILELLTLIDAYKPWTNATDQWRWGRNGDGLYTVRSACALLNNEAPADSEEARNEASFNRTLVSKFRILDSAQ
ncbi:hypothetical protein Ancab_011433 [Ancistrocladus abbreviatus]